MTNGINVFSGLAPASEAAIKIDPEAGGEAPSVEAKTRIATTASNGSTPADTIAVNATIPIAVKVAVDDNGPATIATSSEIISIINHLEISIEPINVVKSSGSPRSVKT